MILPGHPQGQRGALPPWEQILLAAAAAGADAVWDPDNPNTWTLREDGADNYYSAIADGLGNLPAMVQATDASQFLQVTLASGRRGMQGGSPRFMSVQPNGGSTTAQPYTFMTWCETAATGVARSLISGKTTNSYPDTGLSAASNLRAVWAGTSVTWSAASGNTELWTIKYEGSSSYQRLNGAASATVNPSTNAMDIAINWGRREAATPDRYFTTKIGPAILWKSGPDAPTALEALMMNLWPTGVTL